MCANANRDATACNAVTTDAVAPVACAKVAIFAVTTVFAAANPIAMASSAVAITAAALVGRARATTPAKARNASALRIARVKCVATMAVAACAGCATATRLATTGRGNAFVLPIVPAACAATTDAAAAVAHVQARHAMKRAVNVAAYQIAPGSSVEMTGAVANADPAPPTKHATTTSAKPSMTFAQF